LPENEGEGAESGSQASGSTPPAGDLKNKAAKMTMDEAFARIKELEKSNKDQALVITDLTKQLSEANDVLEGQKKGTLISDILAKSTFKLPDLAGKSVDDLKNIKMTLDSAMLPNINSVRIGVHSAELSDREKGLTIGDLSVVTAAQRKLRKEAS
jgi:uncharacterized coiled-coil protein SlyX